MDGGISLVALITVVLFFSSFVYAATVVGLLLLGLGARGALFSVVGLALAMVVAWSSLEPLFAPHGGIIKVSSLGAPAVFEIVAPFLSSKADAGLVERLSGGTAPSMAVLTSAFLAAQLTAAFTFALTVLIPFVVIDLLCAHAITIIGIASLPTAAIALPLKIGVFAAAGGWSLLIGRLVEGG